MMVSNRLCSVCLLFFIWVALCAHAQDALDSVQGRVSNVNVNSALDSAAVNSEVHSRSDQASGPNIGGVVQSSFSASASMSSIKGFGATKDALNTTSMDELNLEAFRGNKYITSSQSGEDALQGAKASGEFRQLGTSRASSSVNGLSKEAGGVTSLPNVLPGEFPDSTRQVVWPSPPFGEDQELFVFSPAILAPSWNFDKLVKLHFFYGRPINIGNGAGFNPVSSSTTISNGLWGNSMGLTPSTLKNGLSTNKFTGMPSTSLQIADPLVSSQHQ